MQDEGCQSLLEGTRVDSNSNELDAVRKSKIEFINAETNDEGLINSVRA